MPRTLGSAAGRWLACALVVSMAVTAQTSATVSNATASGGEAPAIAVALTEGGIVLIDPAGRRLSTLTSKRGAVDWAPAWSPDGARVAFARTTDGHLSSQIYVARADGTGLRRLTRGRFDTQPAWSADGRWIAYAAADGLWLVRPNGSGRHRVLVGWPVSYPSWTPSGELTYSFHPEAPEDWPPACRAPQARCGWVWAMDVNGHGKHPVVHGRDAHWSSDGKLLVHTLPDGGIAVRPASGGRHEFLGRGYLADWSPGGDRIVFARLGPTPAGDSVWVMARDGSGRRRLMSGATDPAWRPTTSP